MSVKDKLVRKLLNIGKKHRILIYPMLALVAVVTAISHAVCWGRGNGKKMVASIMVVALLITQSLFLTSSAVNDGENPEAAYTNTASDAGYDNSVSRNPSDIPTSDDPNVYLQPQQNPENGIMPIDNPEAKTVQVNVHPVTTPAGALSSASISLSVDENGTVSLTSLTNDYIVKNLFQLSDENGNTCFTTDNNLYSDAACQNAITELTGVVDTDVAQDIYVSIYRTTYKFQFTDSNGVYKTYGCTVDNPTKLLNPAYSLDIKPDTVKNTYFLTKYGYQCTSVGGQTVTDGATVSVTPANATDNWVPLQIVWTAASDLTLTYKFYENDSVKNEIGWNTAGSKTETKFTYGSSITLATVDAASTITNKGYYFAGWKIEGDASGKIYEPGAVIPATIDGGLVKTKENINLSPNVEGVTLVGQWKHKTVDLYVDGTKLDGDTFTLSGTYGVDMNHTISAKYDDGTESEKIVIAITNLNDATTGLGTTLGLATSADKNTFKITGTPDNVTISDGVAYTFTVQDTNNASASAITYTLKLKVDPLTVKIGTIKNSTTGGTLTKEYDNSDVIAVRTEAEVTAADSTTPACITEDGVKAVFDATATILGTETKHGEDVGTNKAIRLTNVKLTGTDADKIARCYVLQDVEGGSLVVANAATITKRTLHVAVTYDKTSVKFGEDSPACTLTITDPERIADGNNNEEQNAYNSNPEGFLTNYLNLQSEDKWRTNRKLYSGVGTDYWIEPTFSDAGNYDVVVDALPRFTVTRDSADGRFYVKEKPVGISKLYPSYTVVAENGYDMVRLLLNNSDSDITESMTRAQALALFSKTSASITKDGTYNNVRFQLYNSETGAISSIYTITESITVDTNFPTYVSHSVEPAGFVNQLGFGSYYHSQNSSTGMTLKVVYKTQKSKCEYLYYYFAGEDAEQIPSVVTRVQMKDIGNNMYEATFMIGNLDSGQLVVWAVDEKEYESAHTKLVCYKTNTDAELGAKYYEWMVEDTAPVASLKVQGNSEAAQTDKWYHVLDLSVTANDSDSGLDEIEWQVETPDGSVDRTTSSAYGVNVTKDAKVKDYTFRHVIDADTAGYVPGAYYISAQVKDNAGNITTTQKQGPFLFDNKAPEVEIEDDITSTSKYQSEVTITVKAKEEETESGIDTIALYKDSVETTPIATWSALGEKEWSDSHTVSESGMYIVVVTDVAGNKTTETISYSNVSSVIPDTPAVKIEKGANGSYGNSGWLIEDKPVVTITSTAQTSDKVPVKTYYKVIYTNETGVHESSDSFSSATHSFTLDVQGEVTIEAWAVSESGITSESDTEKAKVDVEGPQIKITDSVEGADGTTTISFQITDLVSGVDTTKVSVNQTALKVTESDGVVKGSFQLDGSASYIIEAQDLAGNEAAPVTFRPLGLSVAPITAITNNTAHMEVQVIQGTNAVSKNLCYIEYKKAGDSGYDTALVNKTDTASGIEMIYDFKKLSADTVYYYRVHAATQNSMEECVVEGSFKTLSGESVTTVIGTATYNSSLPDTEKAKPIYVNLYEGDVVVGGEIVTAAEDTQYMFSGVSDGTYRIVATNGTLTKEASVTVSGGMITYPEDYSTTGGINFVLSGLSTKVVLDSGDVEIAVDGLEKIYDNSHYKGNITDEDLQMVANGGRIDISLHASYISVNNVTSTEIGIFADNLGKNTEVLRYINLYIVKTVYDVNGTVAYTQNLTRLYEPLTISFPLEELAGQNIRIASLHANGSNYTFKNWSDASEAVLTHDYVIIHTDRFSTYALYRITQPKTYTVVWKDGDGNVLKTETVEEGMTATPPEGTPTKTPTDNYIYTFEGWDQDYTNVSKDMVILAWFYSTKKDAPTTETPDTPDAPDAPGTEVTPGTGNNNSNQTPSKQPVKYTYMGATGSPRTGDATPIVLLAGAFVFAGAGIVVLLKKKKSF